MADFIKFGGREGALATGGFGCSTGAGVDSDFLTGGTGTLLLAEFEAGLEGCSNSTLTSDLYNFLGSDGVVGDFTRVPEFVAGSISFSSCFDINVI